LNIVLTSIHIRKSPDAIPLAPALLKSYLLAQEFSRGFNILIQEYYITNNLKEVTRAILKSKPNVVGISVYLWNREFYIELVKEIKRVSPSTIIVAGGAEVRSGYIEFLELGVDYTIQGEGEEAFSELIEALSSDGLSPTSINGINDSSGRFIKNLNSLPSPILTKNIDLHKNDGFLWELSRGCPFSCDFCFESRGAKGVRYYNMERISKELDAIIKANVAQVFVLDPTFNKDLPRAKNILRLILKKNRGTHFHFEIRAELLDSEISNLFAEVGASLQIGIQSAHDEVLKLVNRRLDKDKFSSKIALLNRCGAIFGLDLIYGLPGDNFSGFKNSMEYVLSMQPNHIDIFPLAVLPGTALWDNAKELKLNFTPKPPYTIISSPSYSLDDMKKSEKLKDACNYVYNRAKSTGWFKMVCGELKVSMTDFLIQFYESTNFSNSSNDEVSTIKNFIKNVFKPKNINLITDIINYHTSYSKALLGIKPKTNISKDMLLKSRVSLTPNGTFIDFNYEILTAFDNGCYTIKEIKRTFNPHRNSIITWFHTGGDVVQESYSKEIMNFLKSVDGNKRVLEIDKKIDNDFLIFAQESGLLLFS